VPILREGQAYRAGRLRVCQSRVTDPNPFYERVLYTHGSGLDQPLGVVRMGYTSRLNRHNQAIGRRDFEPVAISILWSTRGEASLGAFADGTWRRCAPDDHCINLNWPDMLAGYGGIQGRRSFWHGTLIEDKSDGSGLKFRRNRYYDPASGRFTQEDPIGTAGGLNLYGYAEGDPVNNHDPTGLYCEKKGEDHLVCKNVRPGDFRTIRNFLGGEAGQSAYETFERAGLTQWDSRTCRGGFSHAQCDQMANGLSNLTLTQSDICARMGVSATKRFQSGRYRWRGGMSAYGMANPFFPLGFMRRVWLGPSAFRPGELSNTIAHEEYHHYRPFAPHSRVHAVGDGCAGAI
jgi:RHS repeat-associated protein